LPVRRFAPKRAKESSGEDEQHKAACEKTNDMTHGSLLVGADRPRPSVKIVYDHHERRSIADVIESAPVAYEQRETGRESPEAFCKRLTETCGEDVDLKALIADHRLPHSGPDL
jgi:hypothetical protein